jgi:hypothetical protein
MKYLSIFFLCPLIFVACWFVQCRDSKPKENADDWQCPQCPSDGAVPVRRDQSFFGIHFDFHAHGNDKGIGQNTTPGMVNAIIDKVRPDYIQIDCKGHPGYSSYPTKAGNPVPDITGDPLRIWRETTAKRGVALYMHYSGLWDMRAAELHPDWTVTSADDTQPKGAESRMSVFGPYADQLLIPQLKELAGVYGVDGAWVDGECWGALPDYGELAVRLFREETGIGNIPKSPADPNWYEWRQFHREGYRKYLRQYVAAVRSEYPAFQICSNWAFTHFMPEPVSVNLDFLSGDYTANNSVNSARYAARYLVHQGISWDLMAWSFCSEPFPKQQKPAAQLKREAAIVLALGGGFQAYFTQNRDGSVRLPELNVMAEVAKFARQRQQWCHRSVQIPQIALLLSTSDFYHDAPMLFWEHKAHSQGVLQCLLECQYSVDMMSEEILTRDMSRFPLIVIPEWKHLTQAFCNHLVDYVKGGGSLLVIGEATSAQIAMLAGVSVQDGSQVLGKGKIGFMPYSFGEEYEHTTKPKPYKDRVNAAIRALFPNPLIEVSGSPYVDVSFSQLNGKRMVHLVNTSGDHKNAGIIQSIEPVGPLQISIRCDQKPSKITLQPAGKTCNFNFADGKAHVKVDKLEIYDILVIE